MPLKKSCFYLLSRERKEKQQPSKKSERREIEEGSWRGKRKKSKCREQRERVNFVIALTIGVPEERQ